MPEVQNADIEWLENGSPFSRQFDDVYYSAEGGYAESEYVFLQSNRLRQRWERRAGNPDAFIIGELGFGTGLNFLLCWQLLEQLALPEVRIHYLAFEQFPLQQSDLRRALDQWPQLSTYSQKLLNEYIDHSHGLHRYCIADKLILDLYYGDAMEGISELLSGSARAIDCWFMDGFSPSKNPALWNKQLLNLMALNSKAGTTVSTYSIAGTVRRNLQAAGFVTDRQPGFGKKREMLLAKIPDSGKSRMAPDNNSFYKRAPWFVVSPDQYNQRKAIVVGAGLAGCATAYSLSKRKWQVTLIEELPEIAGGASGNPQAVLQTRLTANRGVQSRFYLHALLFAFRQFSQFQQERDISWHPCGVVRLPTKSRKGLYKLIARPQQYYSANVVASLTQQQASSLSGTDLVSDALWLPYGGWLNPVKLCQAYLDHSGAGLLKLVSGRTATALQQQQDQWCVYADKNLLASAPLVILCNSYQATSLQQTSFLPLVPVRGQVTQIPISSESQSLNRVVVMEKYICPNQSGLHTIGASYARYNSDCVTSKQDDMENIAGIKQAFSQKELIAESAQHARASVRCNSADFFPVVGAVPDYQDFTQTYAALSRNAEAQLDKPARYLPGLFVNTAHGSHGLASCPLSAEMIASLVNNESRALPAAITDSLSPARFIIRELKRQQHTQQSSTRHPSN